MHTKTTNENKELKKNIMSSRNTNTDYNQRSITLIITFN